MTRPERRLKLFLQLVGVGCLLALAAVVMPASWMADLHQRAGLGTYPDKPVTDYLARSTSIMWAFMGALFIFAASDIRRYRALIVFLAAALFIIGAALVIVDILNAFPWWWVVGEFLCAAPISLIALLLLKGVLRSGEGKPS